MTDNILLEVNSATKHYKTRYFLPKLFSRPSSLQALDNVSLQLHTGEIVGIIGQSGSGKTTLGKAIVKLTHLNKGTIRLMGTDITELSQRQFRSLRKNVQMIFQDLDAALNPSMRVVDILSAIYLAHYAHQKQLFEPALKNVMQSVFLDKSVLHMYPTQLSGGQKRRIAIAGVLLVQPKIIIADEPTSGLDAHVQQVIMQLLLKLQYQNKLSMILISHDLNLIQQMCQRIMVMYHGKIIESGTKDDVINNPKHPYTKQLIAAAKFPMATPTKTHYKIP